MDSFKLVTTYIVLITDLYILDELIVRALSRKNITEEYIFCHFNNDKPIKSVIEKWEDNRIRYVKIPVGINSETSILDWIEKYAKTSNIHLVQGNKECFLYKSPY